MPPQAEYEARGNSPESPLSISQLNWLVKQALEQALPKVWVEGEISDLSRPSSGHLYFTLKDDRSQVRGVIWRSTAQRLKFQLEDGLSVICSGAVEVYSPRGSYQLIVKQIQPAGLGPLQLAFQQLHQKLSAEGLFAAERKRPIPPFPKRIGFVTSPSGAALHDFLETARGLWPAFQLTIIPARVQGQGAAKEIVRGIQLAQQLTPPLDLLVVGRGGGSLEDLWCFNEEAVVRALANCKLPTVSAVGHEIDVTLSDLAADARGLTPTHAAQLIFPSQAELTGLLNQLHRRIDANLRNRIAQLRERLQHIQQRRVLTDPHQVHKQKRQLIDDWELRGRDAIWRLWTNRREKLSAISRAVEALSPLAVLARGYSLTQNPDSQQPIRTREDVRIGDSIQTVVQEAMILSQVQQVTARSDEADPKRVSNEAD